MRVEYTRECNGDSSLDSSECVCVCRLSGGGGGFVCGDCGLLVGGQKRFVAEKKERNIGCSCLLLLNF